MQSYISTRLHSSTIHAHVNTRTRCLSRFEMLLFQRRFAAGRSRRLECGSRESQINEIRESGTRSAVDLRLTGGSVIRRIQGKNACVLFHSATFLVFHGRADLKITVYCQSVPLLRSEQKNHVKSSSPPFPSIVSILISYFLFGTVRRIDRREQDRRIPLKKSRCANPNLTQTSRQTMQNCPLQFPSIDRASRQSHPV